MLCERTVVYSYSYRGLRDIRELILTSKNNISYVFYDLETLKHNNILDEHCLQCSLTILLLVVRKSIKCYGIDNHMMI